MKSHLFLFIFFSSLVDLLAYTDPSVINPQLAKKFEYKLSFRGPHVSFKDGSVPFWTTGGSAIATDDQVRVTPSIRSQKGRIWSKTPLTADNWLLELKLRITGRGRVGADGMAIWFTEEAGVEGSVFGSNDQWKGLGVFLDSFDNDGLQNNPIIAVMINDGTKSYDHHHDGSSQIQGQCVRDFRNKPLPIRLKIEYINQVLTIYLNNGLSQDDTAFELCTRVDRVQLPKSGFLGVTAATGGLADDHDVLDFLTHSFMDRQSNPQNQAATDEEIRKYNEEFIKYEEELKKQQQEFRKAHPDATTPINEQQMFESEYDREFRTILEGQDQIRLTLHGVDQKVAELLGRIERLSLASGVQSQGGTASSSLPNDVARVQDVNRVISANTEMTRTIQSFAQVLTDLQQKITNLQSSTGKSQPTMNNIGGQVDSNVLNDLRETVRQIKSETTSLLQKSSNQNNCPSVALGTDSSCVGFWSFVALIGFQLVVVIGFLMFKGRKDQLSRKYL